MFAHSGAGDALEVHAAVSEESWSSTARNASTSRFGIPSYGTNSRHSFANSPSSVPSAAYMRDTDGTSFAYAPRSGSVGGAWYREIAVDDDAVSDQRRRRRRARRSRRACRSSTRCPPSARFAIATRGRFRRLFGGRRDARQSSRGHLAMARPRQQVCSALVSGARIAIFVGIVALGGATAYMRGGRRQVHRIAGKYARTSGGSGARWRLRPPRRQRSRRPPGPALASGSPASPATMADAPRSEPAPAPVPVASSRPLHRRILRGAAARFSVGRQDRERARTRIPKLGTRAARSRRVPPINAC